MVNMLIVIMPAIWVSFTSCIGWYLTYAKRSVPITFDDAKALWQIHKKTANCSCLKWSPISHKGEKISGFRCECGYTYTQRSPLISDKPRSRHCYHKSQQGFPLSSYWISFLHLNLRATGIYRELAETSVYNNPRSTLDLCLCLGIH